MVPGSHILSARAKNGKVRDDSGRHAPVATTISIGVAAPPPPAPAPAASDRVAAVAAPGAAISLCARWAVAAVAAVAVTPVSIESLRWAHGGMGRKVVGGRAGAHTAAGGRPRASPGARAAAPGARARARRGSHAHAAGGCTKARPEETREHMDMHMRGSSEAEAQETTQGRNRIATIKQSSDHVYETRYKINCRKCTHVSILVAKMERFALLLRFQRCRCVSAVFEGDVACICTGGKAKRGAIREAREGTAYFLPRPFRKGSNFGKQKVADAAETDLLTGSDVYAPNPRDERPL